MTILAKDVIRRAADILQDTTGVRWPTHELVRWFNTSQRDILIHRPDALRVGSTFTCVAGSKQTLPATAAKLLDVVNNVTGSKRAIRLVNREVLDAQSPTWHSATQSSEILHYTYDVRDPKTLYVYPPAANGTQINIVTANYPTDIAEPAVGADYAAVSGNMSLPDEFESVLLDLILYRAYSKDSEYAGNATRAQAHYVAAANTLGIEIKSFMLSAPTVTGAALNPNAAKVAA